MFQEPEEDQQIEETSNPTPLRGSSGCGVQTPAVFA
jgi:hypothetical protein